MLTITINDSIEGVWKDFTLHGQPIRIRVRPRTMEKVREIRERHKTLEWVLNTETKVMERVEVYDEDAISMDVYDWMIQEMEGVDLKNESGKPLSLTAKTKAAILRAGRDEDLGLKVLEQANALALAVEAGKKAEAGN